MAALSPSLHVSLSCIFCHYLETSDYVANKQRTLSFTLSLSCRLASLDTFTWYLVLLLPTQTDILIEVNEVEAPQFCVALEHVSILCIYLKSLVWEF